MLVTSPSLTSMRVSSGRSGASKVTAPSKLAARGSARLQQWPGAESSGASPQAPGTKWRAEEEPVEPRELEEPTVGRWLVRERQPACFLPCNLGTLNSISRVQCTSVHTPSYPDALIRDTVKGSSNPRAPSWSTLDPHLPQDGSKAMCERKGNTAITVKW